MVIGFGVLATIYLWLLHFLSDSTIAPTGLIVPLVLTGMAILVGKFSLIKVDEGGRWVLTKIGVILSGLGIVSLVLTLISGNTQLALLSFGLFYGLSLGFSWLVFTNKRRIIQWAVLLGLCLVMGALPVVLVQILNRFSDEEFFAAVQAVSLAFYWLLLWSAVNQWKKKTEVDNQAAFIGISRPIFLIFSALLFSGFFALGIYVYQHSFYPDVAPSFSGISEQKPFLCGDAADPVETTSSITATDVTEKYLDGLESKSVKSVPDEAALYLGTGEAKWAQAFHDGILNEATQKLFTQPANSVKSIQYDAALRVYFYTQVVKTDPELFTQAEQSQVRQWFQQIDQRALTVEWVDLMYALAFSKLPEGPYENQENGAGLLALIETGGYADTALSTANQAYLAANQRGWLARFRNTDDAIIYQPEWLNNAYFQSLYSGDVPSRNLAESFEWLLLQALPDGRSPQYNHPVLPVLADSFLLGADLLQDGQLLWLASQAFDSAPTGRIVAQPGVEQPVELTATPPTTGSCLLYGDSGLPNQVGPLAPDKIVFRDGWNADDTYMMLNLRFTGWHRYKGTNSIVTIDKGGPLVEEDNSGNSFSWLPTGRSLFRDKRIPRENLNGFLISRQGMDQVLYLLTGIGGLWAQNPPDYATVDSFMTGQGMDYSRTSISGWNGWDQTRSIYFYHDGPIVIYDQAQGPASQATAVSWQINGSSTGEENRFILDNGTQQMEMVLLPQSGGSVISAGDSGSESQAVVYEAQAGGTMKLVTVFLNGRWMGATLSLENTQTGQTIKIQKNGQTCSLSLGEPNPAQLEQSCQ